MNSENNRYLEGKRREENEYKEVRIIVSRYNAPDQINEEMAIKIALLRKDLSRNKLVDVLINRHNTSDQYGDRK